MRDLSGNPLEYMYKQAPKCNSGICMVNGQISNHLEHTVLEREQDTYVVKQSIPLCVEIIPSAPSDGLIGRIGNHLFFVGQAAVIVSEDSGELALRINDDPQGLYDNDGILTISILIR